VELNLVNYAHSEANEENMQTLQAMVLKTRFLIPEKH
jgi:hypothetical protein